MRLQHQGKKNEEKIDYKLKQKYICTSLYSESVWFGLCWSQDFGGDSYVITAPNLLWGVYIKRQHEGITWDWGSELQGSPRMCKAYWLPTETLTLALTPNTLKRA